MNRKMSQTTAYMTKQFGAEREPVVIIDGFCSELGRLLEGAGKAAYQPAMGYPGVRAPADLRYLSPHAERLADILYDVFGFSVGFRAESCSFSIVTMTPDQLAVSQRIPHYDDTGPDLLALLHYSSGPETGGTAFYRHRRTGFETINHEREQAYRQALRLDDQEFGLPPARYCYGDSDRYEMIGEVEARANRMVIYRGRTLHSGVIPPDLPLVSDPSLGRLTINTFVTGVR